MAQRTRKPSAPFAGAASAIGLALLALAGCDGPAPDAAATTEAVESDVATAEPSVAASGTGAASAVADTLDMSALTERQDPERLLRYFANAMRVGDWADAAKAWGLDAQMTPDILRMRYGGDAGPKITFGKGDTEGAAGSLYYEAPTVIDYADGRPSQRGTIVLRRVNDVPGASDEQLNWRIERISIPAS